MRAWSAAMRSSNHGCCVLQTWGCSSRSTAAGWSPIVGHRLDRLLRADQQLARRRRGAGGHLLGRRQQVAVVDAAVHETDALGLACRPSPRRTARRPSSPAGRRCAAASTCGRRPGGCRSAGTGCRTGPARRRGARRSRAPCSCRRRPPPRSPRRASAAGCGRCAGTPRTRCRGSSRRPRAGCRGWRRRRTRAACR